MPCPLRKGQVLVVVFVIDPSCCKMLDGCRQQMRIIRACYLLGNFMFFFLSRMDHEWFSFNQRPFYRFFRAVHFKALPVLPCRIKQRPVNMCTQIRIPELDMRRLHGKGRAIMVMQFFANRSGPEARHVFSLTARKSEYGAYTMCRIVHGRQTRPIIRPSIHVLLVPCFEELDF